jgi:hypothetical protein
MTKLRGVRFGDRHTAEDWGLIMNEKVVSPPLPKTNYVSVPGRDGDIDLSEALSGVVNYQDRTASFTFLLTNGSHADREALISEIVGTLHGQSMEIEDTDDYPGYYLTGRITVQEVANNAAYGTIKLQAVCRPWRYAVNETIKPVTLSSAKKTVNVVNKGYKTVTPSVTVTGSVTIKYGTTSTSLSSGTYTLPGFSLKPGLNTVTVSGSGTLEIRYREAIL